MRPTYPLLISISLLLLCCGLAQTKNKNQTPHGSLIDARGANLNSRFKVPAGYIRTNEKENSFATFLRDLPLKPNGAKVHLYDGREKWPEIYEAVVDLDIGDKDLEQCADAVIRLRAEYFYSLKQYDKISFNFTNGFKADYKEWMEGNRIVVKGNEVAWHKTTKPSNTYKSFRNYLDIVFSYAGTLSLSKSLKPKNLQEIAIGDVFIRGGSPGHAVIVVDMAINQAGEKIFMLAQSYMPAQDIQILKNLNAPETSPWYKVNTTSDISTPQWVFTIDELKSFE